jgi:Tfp pilus assembly protein PilO
MMTFNKLTPREKKILYVVVGLLVLVFGYHGIARPLTEKLSDLETEIFAMQMKLRKAKIYLRQKEEILEESKKYANLSQMDAGSDEEEIARLLNLIEQTARKTGISLSDVKPEQVRSDKTIKRYIVQLNAESSLEQLMSFIHELEHSPQILKIDKMSTVPKEDKSAVLRSTIIVTRVVLK